MPKGFKHRSQLNNEQLDQLLSDYMDGLLTGNDQQVVDTWLQEDTKLQQRLAGLRMTVNLLSNLPEVEMPRNFILSPSMVAPAKPQPRRQRRTWPVFGWATAAAALLFFLVFASDVFVVAPSLRPKSAEPVARVATSVEQEMPVPQPGLGEEPIAGTAVDQVSSSEEPMMAVEAPVEAVEAVSETVVEKEVVVEVTLEVETEVVVTQVAEAVEMAQTAPVEAAQEAEPEASPGPPSGGGGEPPQNATAAKMLVSPASEIEESATPSVQGTPAPADAAVETEKEVIITPEPFVGEEASLSQIAPEGDSGTQYNGEQVVLPTPASVAAAPLDVTPEVRGAEQSAKEVPLWLRLLEVGLGSAVIAFAAATLVIRWLESKRSRNNAD